ncbi:MAG: hypothetical protein R3F61_26630 [Myxococcota bacterium]
MNTAPDLDARTAAVIAVGMRKVALADGDVMHPNELSLIEQFEQDIPAGTEPNALIGDARVREIYLKSLVMVALADGRISANESAVITDLAAGVGADSSDVERTMDSVKREFLAVFSGVTHFRDQVKAVADELGVDLD